MVEPSAWVLTDGKAGTHNQALGLAEAVGLPFTEKHIHSALPWRWLPPALWPPGVLGVGRGDALEPPWPTLAISSGERAVAPALAIRRHSGGAVFSVHIQHPRVNAGGFDLVVVSAHDRLSGPNVRVTLGALNRITPAKLEAAATRFSDTFAHLPRPLVAVLVGGSNRVYRMSPRVISELARNLATMARDSGAGLLVTISRRTGAQAGQALRDALDGLPVWFWDGAGENPYFAFLALADSIVVTADSVSMVSEAAATGKPVHVVALEGGERGKFARFHEAFRNAGITRSFSGKLDSWQYEPLRETTDIAAEIKQRIGTLVKGRMP
jgi:hypothetical protein